MSLLLDCVLLIEAVVAKANDVLLSVSAFSSSVLTNTALRLCQVDEASLRDVCSEFGHLETVAINADSETAVVQYSTREQAMQAKIGLDKSPVVCGVSITVDFVSKQKASNFVAKQQQQQQQQQVDGSTTQSGTQDQWSGETRPATSGSSGGGGGLANGRSHWDGMSLGQFSQSHSTTAATSSSGPPGSGEAATTPWSNSGFLPGLTSPWSSQPHTESALFPSSTSTKQETAGTMSSSLSLSTYLPNGLF